MSLPASSSQPAEQGALPARAPYVSPTLEPLGSWSALTMQGSLPGVIDPSIARIVLAPLD